MILSNRGMKEMLPLSSANRDSKKNKTRIVHKGMSAKLPMLTVCTDIRDSIAVIGGVSVLKRQTLM
jgi:hypothetical protein